MSKRRQNMLYEIRFIKDSITRKQTLNVNYEVPLEAYITIVSNI